MRDKVFSIFTCTYKTPKEQIHRLYTSLIHQTYKKWNWWILDDSPNDYTENIFEEIEHDYRVHIIKNVSHHGNIGYNKHLIAMCCDGDYLVEVDHDDELIKDCLKCLYDAFMKYPHAKYAYSDVAEMIGDHTVINYGDDFSFGQGYYRTEMVEGWTYPIAITCPSINCKSIRGIYAQPNHVRCWEKDFYHKIGGHDITLPVCDDADINIRTFLNTRIVHINKVLYIQYEDGERGNANSNNTQNKRFKEIQELNWELYAKYDLDIHNRIIELCGNDQIWNEKKQQSDVQLNIPRETLIDLGYQYL